MPGINKNVTGDSPTFGHNNFLASTTYQPPESRTVSSASHPVEPDLEGNQKSLHPGEVLAKITSGDEAGKTGVYQLGATDGRADAANIVGLNKDFWPYQLMDRDVETANLYDCYARQAWCSIRDADGNRVPLPNEVADAMRGLKGLDVHFK